MEPDTRDDALTRMLLENHPLDGLALLGIEPGQGVKVINSDLSTVIAEADKVLWIETPEPWIVHVDVQSSYRTEVPQRLLRYHVLLNVRHEVPVHSVLVLLFPEADGPAISRRYQQASPDGRCRNAFAYQVVRVWQESPVTLAAGLGTIPLAALAVPPEKDLPALVQRMKTEFARHHEPMGVKTGRNLLATGAVSVEEVVDLLGRCRGNQYESSPHHDDLETMVHIFKPVKQKQAWYVKLYFVETDEESGLVMFVSVHRSAHSRGG